MGEIKRLGLAQQLWRHGHIGHVKLLSQLSKAGLEVRTFAGIAWHRCNQIAATGSCHAITDGTQGNAGGFELGC